MLIPLLPKKKANTLLGEIAANYAEYVTPKLPSLIKGSVEEDEPWLVCLVLKLPKQEYSFYEEIEQIATDMGRFRVVEAVKKVKGVAPLPPSHS